MDEIHGVMNGMLGSALMCYGRSIEWMGLILFLYFVGFLSRDSWLLAFDTRLARGLGISFNTKLFINCSISMLK